MNEHEEAWVRSFVIAPKQERCLELLASKKGRGKLRESLAHFHDLDPKYQSVADSSLSAEDLARQLRAMGAPEQCQLLSETAKLDGKQMALQEALEAAMGSGFGTLVSCLPGKLAYFENEDGAWLLRR